MQKILIRLFLRLFFREQLLQHQQVLVDVDFRLQQQRQQQQQHQQQLKQLGLQHTNIFEAFLHRPIPKVTLFGSVLE